MIPAMIRWYVIYSIYLLPVFIQAIIWAWYLITALFGSISTCRFVCLGSRSRIKAVFVLLQSRNKVSDQLHTHMHVYTHSCIDVHMHARAHTAHRGANATSTSQEPFTHGKTTPSKTHHCTIKSLSPLKRRQRTVFWFCSIREPCSVKNKQTCFDTVQ